jgi:hypothetical protein
MKIAYTGQDDTNQAKKAVPPLRSSGSVPRRPWPTREAIALIVVSAQVILSAMCAGVVLLSEPIGSDPPKLTRC